MSNNTQGKGPMNESVRESLSALMDGEASEIELHRILSCVEDSELRAAWSGMHRNSDLMRGSAQIANIDISGAVRRSIGNINAVPATERSFGGVRRSLASFAIAASVTAVVVFSGQQLLTSPDTRAPRSIGSPGLVNSPAAVPVRASFGSRQEQSSRVLQPAAGAGYQEMARQRLRKYSQAHVEDAALNTPQGFLPLARVKDIQP